MAKRKSRKTSPKRRRRPVSRSRPVMMAPPPPMPRRRSGPSPMMMLLGLVVLVAIVMIVVAGGKGMGMGTTMGPRTTTMAPMGGMMGGIPGWAQFLIVIGVLMFVGALIGAFDEYGFQGKGGQQMGRKWGGELKEGAGKRFTALRAGEYKPGFIGPRRDI